MEKDLINTADAAKILDVDTSTLRKWRQRKLFGCTFFDADEKHGDTWYYKRERVEQLKEVYQKGVLQNMYKLAKKFAEKELSDNFQKRGTSRELQNLKKIILDVDDVAEILSITARQVQKLCKENKLDWYGEHDGTYWLNALDVYKFKADRDAQKNNSQDSWLDDYRKRFQPTITDADIVAIRKLTANPDKFNELKQKILLIDPDKIFQNDRYKGYICPICGSGSGRHGTGFQRPKNAVVDKDGVKKYLYHCFPCGNFKGDLLKIIANINELDLTNDFLQIMAIGKKILESAYSGKFEDISIAPPSVVKLGEISDDEFLQIKDDIFRAQQNFNQMPSTADFTRGISTDVLKKIRAGYLTDWIHPRILLDPARKKYPSRRLIIPCGWDSYDAIQPLCDRNDYNKDFKNLHAGIKQELFSVYSSNGRTSFKDFRFALIFEGSIDALSAYDVNRDYWALASLGTTNLDNTINFLNRDFETTDERFNFQPIVVFDNEEKANRKALELVDALKKSGYPAISLTLGKIGADKVDANSILMTDGHDALKAKLAELVSDAQKQLPAIQAELKAEKTATNNNDSPAENSETPKDFSDAANAQRLFEYCKEKIRYLYDVDKWAFFDGGKWNIALNATAAPLYKFALALGKSTDNTKVAKIFSTTKKINGAIALVKGIRDAIITRADLNQHPNLLNCQNGVVDLQTKKLYPADPSLLLTQMINADFRADYHNETVEKFLRDIMPDDDTLAALLRFLGYCLTGEVSEEKAMIFNGGGGNGKGTLTGTLLNLFGNYGTPFPVGAILTPKFGGDEDANAPTPAYTKLVDTRIAISEEIPQGRTISAAKFKLLTGGDRIPIRRLREEATEIEHPTHKLVISGNYLPELQDAADAGIIRRLMNIQFTQKFDDKTRDIHLKKKLVTPDALSGLLTLLVDNAAQWYQSGLLESAAMTDAKRTYINDQDFISAFVDEYCDFSPSFSISMQKLIEKLREHFTDETKFLTDKSLRTMIKKTLESRADVKRGSRKNAVVFFGIDYHPANAARDHSESIDTDTPL